MMSTQHDPLRTWCAPRQSDSTLLEALQLFEGGPCKNDINNGNNDDDNNDYGNNDNHDNLQLFKGQNLKMEGTNNDPYDII